MWAVLDLRDKTVFMTTYKSKELALKSLNQKKKDYECPEGGFAVVKLVRE